MTPQCTHAGVVSIDECPYCRPTTAEQFIAWAEKADPIQPPGCPCDSCAAIKREVHSAKVYRHALEQIVRMTAFPDSQAAQLARRTAQQALEATK